MPVFLNGAALGQQRARFPTVGEQTFELERRFLTESRQANRQARGEKILSIRKTQAAVSVAPAISLPGPQRSPGAVGGGKLALLECAAKGGTLILGRCAVPTAVPTGVATVVPTRGEDMGLRAQLISPDFLPTGGSPLLGGLIQGGLDILGSFVSSKFGLTGVPSPSPTPLAVTTLGGLIPTGGPVGLAAVSGAIVAAGGAIVGTVIRISSAAWRAVPSLIKQAALALGLTVAFTDVGVADITGLFGGGDGLSQAQQRKIAKFQAMTSAGVPPGLAARATGIGRKRRRGISAFELSGFRKISHLLGHVGMVPRGLRGARPARGHHHHK